MKKVIAYLMTVLLFLSGCSRGETGSRKDKEPDEKKVATLEEFDVKYRRADFDAFLEDPTEFLRDLKNISKSNICSQDELPFDGWEVTEESDPSDGESRTHWSSVQKECVLFNKALLYSAYIYFDDEDKTAIYYLYVEFDSDDVQKDLAIARALYFGLVSEEGDPTELSIGLDDVEEPAVIRILDGTDEPNWFTAQFADGSTVSLIAFKHYDGTWSSHVSITRT